MTDPQAPSDRPPSLEPTAVPTSSPPPGEAPKAAPKGRAKLHAFGGQNSQIALLERIMNHDPKALAPATLDIRLFKKGALLGGTSFNSKQDDASAYTSRVITFSISRASYKTALAPFSKSTPACAATPVTSIRQFPVPLRAVLYASPCAGSST